MPTGYTADIYEGKDDSFKDFAMKCARAFGACIEMRDEPLNALIPEKFPVSTYHKDRLEEETIKLKEFNELGAFEKLTQFNDEKYSAINSCKKGIEKNLKTLDQYIKMLDKVNEFITPTEDHNNFKQFMIDQLTDSINHDCNIEYREKELKKLEAQTYDDRFTKKCDGLNWSINYHQKEIVKETERGEHNNDWLIQLRKSLETL